MQKHLFFVCPTDHLEAIINDKFREENYYLTALGNSVAFNTNLITEINALIARKNITEITFVLSDNNQILLDALRHQNFAGVRGLDHFYYEITKQKRLTERIWQKCNLPISVLSYYLNLKIKELTPLLNNGVDQINVNASVYNRKRKIFRAIGTDLFQREYHSLN